MKIQAPAMPVRWMHICLRFIFVCLFVFSSHCIPVLVFPTYSGLDMIGLKDYEQLECMPLLKKDVNAYHFCVFRDCHVWVKLWRHVWVFCFLCAKRQKIRQYECRDILLKHWMFLINVHIDLRLHYPVDVWPYARFVLACECNEVIVKRRIQMGFFCT